MKYLTFILCLFSFCFGQQDSVKIIDTDGTIKVIPSPTITVESEYTFAARKIIAELFLEYEKECYADSTFVEMHCYKYQGDEYFRPKDCIDPGFYLGYVGLKSWYEHKEPTFKGFIEFIKKRLKWKKN